MKTTTFIKEFLTYDLAFDYMLMKNIAFRKANNLGAFLNVVPGPDNNFAVVDDMTAIELGLGYVCASSTSSYISNPFN